MGSSSTPSRTTQVTEPPDFIEPYMEYGAQQSRALYETGGPQYYPGNTVVPFSQQTEQALGLTEQRALQGSQVTNAAQDYATGVLGGNYLPGGSQGNPYLDATFNKAALATQNQLASEFARSGRNVDASEGLRAQQLEGLATSIYGGAYDAERQRQQAMVPFSTQLANQDYVDLQALQGVGGQVEDLTGRLMQDQAARFDYSQNRPQINLDNYISRITGAYPGQNATQVTPTYRNRTAGAAGGAMAGAQLGSQIYPGWGTAIGAIAGGLLGGWG